MITLEVFPIPLNTHAMPELVTQYVSFVKVVYFAAALNGGVCRA